jgi:hypothetical protein
MARFRIKNKHALAGVVGVNSKVVGLGPGTDAMILIIFSPKILATILAFFAQTTASFCKKLSITLLIDKNAH